MNVVAAVVVVPNLKELLQEETSVHCCSRKHQNSYLGTPSVLRNALSASASEVFDILALYKLDYYYYYYHYWCH